MFYDLFKKLCDDRNISVSKACIEIGLSRSIAAKWKNTKTNPSADDFTKNCKVFWRISRLSLRSRRKNARPYFEGRARYF